MRVNPKSVPVLDLGALFFNELSFDVRINCAVYLFSVSAFGTKGSVLLRCSVGIAGVPESCCYEYIGTGHIGKAPGRIHANVGQAAGGTDADKQ